MGNSGAASDLVCFSYKIDSMNLVTMMERYVNHVRLSPPFLFYYGEKYIVSYQVSGHLYTIKNPSDYFEAYSEKDQLLYFIFNI